MNTATSFKKGFDCYYRGMGTVTLDEKEEAIGYTEPVDGLTEFYPATGFINYETGAMESVGEHSGSWSGTVSGNYGSYMRFRAHSMTPFNTSYRAYGFMARCVKEQ